MDNHNCKFTLSLFALLSPQTNNSKTKDSSQETSHYINQLFPSSYMCHKSECVLVSVCSLVILYLSFTCYFPLIKHFILYQFLFLLQDLLCHVSPVSRFAWVWKPYSYVVEQVIKFLSNSHSRSTSFGFRSALLPDFSLMDNVLYQLPE